ncbi:RmlC-like cupin domain-containing protein [Melanogaster broomeanus]|nr:RmlC-like cupin domain-containing protein [Melanogaster broomeanus]
MSTSEAVFRIAPTLQKYGWGKIGNDSRVAQLAAGADLPNFVLDETTPYAELWMGTHVTSPSGVVGSRLNLPKTLAANPHLIGSRVSDKFPTSNGNLPFLFKVLSINKALSIQIHPDKKTAEKLHAAQPTVYTDDNHKPEMAIALTDFRGLCGFSPIPEIKAYLTSVPEFRSLVSNEIAQNFLSAHGKNVGVFCAFMLNYVKLKPGQAIFLGAGEPHAYVSGDIMECMANSDNVIRAGLTPKPKDLPNLLSGLTYKPAPWSNHMVKPSTSPGSATITLRSSYSGFHLPIHGPSIAIVTEGSGSISWDNDAKSLELKPGNVAFIAADVPVAFRTSANLTVY